MSMSRTTAFAVKPLGYRADGSPFWNYFGSAPDDGDAGAGSDDGGAGDGDGDGDGSGGDDDDAVDDQGLNGKGRRAIDAERAAADRAKKAYKPWGALRRDFGMTPDEIREVLSKRSKDDKGDSKDSKDVDPDAIRREAETSAQVKVNDKLRRAAVRVVAADLLKFPADAEKFIDISEYEVDDDGDVDSAQISRDIRELLASRPELGKVAKKGGPGGGNPDFDGGSRGGAGGGQKTMSEIIRGAVRR